ncbi:TetR/AcrR family transcriptional regulator [Anaerosporobacter faecicola]|uniref:TetR/AcrR family transcriptional regulator n=1 Tax=Anaerosporobacter faecicola TaxID=2718714 RepID=UPI0014395107|nr:TetR/AcrR family transcriptional regulator [Anaerosporobacter faecicola]
MRVFDEVDRQIIEVTRTLFLEQGMRKTEMKDIAKHVGIGRSTLYRRFVNKEAISFYIAMQILGEIQEEPKEMKTAVKKSGYEKLSQYLNYMVDTMIENPEKIRFLDEFDQIFTDVYPDSEEARDYVAFNNQYRNPANKYYREGLADGSIRRSTCVDNELGVIISLLLGLAQRVIPREQHYIQEHHQGSRKYFDDALVYLLSPIKNMN